MKKLKKLIERPGYRAPSPSNAEKASRESRTLDLIGPKYPPGSRVRLTGEFLKNTGQQVGEEGQKVFVVQDCACSLCGTCRFVLVNDPVWCEERHLAIGNICGEHELTIRNDP